MIYSKKLAKYKEITHGITTRKDGDFRELFYEMKDGKNLNDIYKELAKINLNKDNLFLTQQVHGDKIQEALSNSSQIFFSTDGLWTKDKGVVLGIRTADCVPIIFFEPTIPLVAIVHSGWRGIIAKITSKMVKNIKAKGGNPKNLILVIGPHIGKCCYDIDKARVALFKDKFGSTDFILRRGEKDYLDLSKAVIHQLLEEGVSKKNIEDLSLCTYEDKEFYSFRRSKKEKSEYGEMLTFIGLK